MTWQGRERSAARVLGTRRVVRARGESAPDVEPVVLPSGEVLSVEVKHRRRLPALLVAALTQAARYCPGGIPVAVVSQHGGRQLLVVDLEAFARLVGIAVPALPARASRRRCRRWVQTDLPGVP